VPEKLSSSLSTIIGRSWQPTDPLDRSTAPWLFRRWDGRSGHQYGFTSVDDNSYQLRPEAIEIIFIMWRCGRHADRDRERQIGRCHEGEPEYARLDEELLVRGDVEVFLSVV
jgi:hypothetical protein